MLSVSIVTPSWHYFADPFKLQPLLELYFATVIDSRFKGKEVKVGVVDLREMRRQQNNFQPDKISTYVLQQDLYLYWIAKTADYLEIKLIVEELRRLYPQAKHAAGGTHIDNFPNESEAFFDAIVLGPGEESFIKIVNDSLKGSLQKRYQSDWQLVKYADYPIARRDYLPKEAIVNRVLFEKYGGVLGTSFLFSRGCCFKCAYCVYNVPPMIQRRTDQLVKEEIEYLKKEYGIEGVNLRDEICIPVLEKEAVSFLQVMGDAEVIWRGQTRVTASKEMLTLARQTGCIELAIGVESVSPQVLDIINKKQTVEQVRNFIAAAKEVGIKIKMCLILGLPGEPPNIVEMTQRFIEETQPEYVNISGFCPIPGSPIYQNPKDYGIKHIDRDWSKFAHLVYRFSDDEEVGIPFEYEKTNHWGKTFTRPEIINNIKELQHYLQERQMSY